jgi:predicted ATPase
MYISHVVIRNFKAIAEIDCELSPRINVIVGPNAVGKTTILQAVRLAKAIVAPRTPQEVQQVFISLGAASPHFPQRLFLNNLARDSSKQIEVRCTFVLTPEEISILESSVSELVQGIVASRLGQGFSNPASLVQFLESSAGKLASSTTTSEIRTALKGLTRTKSLTVGVALNSKTGQIVLSNPLGGPLIGFLDLRLPPHLSVFSYFPADRALPMGDVNLQVGGPDAQQQLESHNSQPQMKYTRLKNLMINSLLLGNSDHQTLREEFEIIFSGLLKGRRIRTINFNDLGLLSVMTEEIATGSLIELDSLSSGEKNIALTFLLVARTVANGGIALFDEPELHLNPAVSRDVLPFVLRQYSKPKNIQFLMCTHSPEILSGAFSSDDCTLLHLTSTSNISRVGKRAVDEYADALQRLGTSVGESLLYQGTVLVEGDSDVAFLESGFPEIFRKYKVKDRGGRREVEKTINEIQALEKKKEKVAPIYVIFDLDDDPTTLKDSAAVKILQWPRRCVENYLLDLDVISELLKDSAVVKEPMSNEGEVRTLLRNLAYTQLDSIAARVTYNDYNFRNASLKKEDVQDGDIPKLANSLFDRMSSARASIPDTPRDAWIDTFQRSAEIRKEELHLEWEANWRDLCDGKKLISDLHKAAGLKMSEASFKMRIIQMMRETTSEDWRLVKGILENFIAPSSR